MDPSEKKKTACYVKYDRFGMPVYLPAYLQGDQKPLLSGVENSKYIYGPYNMVFQRGELYFNCFLLT